MKATTLQGDTVFSRVGGTDDIKKLSVPGYQRTYSWEPDHIEALWNTIETCYGESEDYRHFMGSILLQESSSDKVFEVVDGQQRMITLALLSRIIVALADHHKLELINRNEPKAKFVDDIINMFFYNNNLKVNVQNKDNNWFTLIMKENSSNVASSELLKHFESLESEFTKNKDTFPTNKIEHNSLLLYGKVVKLIEDYNAESLYHLARIISKNFSFVQIVLEPTEDAYTIFSTMNSLGKSLTFPDIIKSLLTSKAKDLALQWEQLFEIPSTDDDSQNFWDEKLEKGTTRSRLEDFFTCYLIAKDGDFGNKNIASRQKDYKLNIQQYDDKKIDDEWTDIKQYAKIYEKIHSFDGTINIKKAHYSLILRMTTVFGNYSASTPAIMIIENKHKGDEALYHKLAILMLKETLNIGEFKLSSVPKIVNIDAAIAAKKEWAVLVKKAANTNPRTTKLLRAIEDAITLEQALTNNNATTVTNSFKEFNDKLSLEHFYPKSKGDTLENNLVESIGNKTILTGKVNSSFNNSAPSQKLNNTNRVKFGDLYTNGLGNIIIDNNLTLSPNWDEKKIIARETAIIKLVEKHFS